MIHYRLSCIFAVTLSFLFSCNSDRDLQQPEPVPISFTTINGDTSDLEQKPQFSYWGRDIEGAFSFEKNYFFNKDNVFDNRSGFYLATYSGQGIINCKVFNQTMSASSSSNINEDLVSGVWRKLEVMPVSEKLTWQFVNATRDKGYKIDFSDVPGPIKIESMPETFSLVDKEKEYVVYFNKTTPVDSVLFALVAIPKKNFVQRSPSDQNSSREIYSQYNYQIKAQENRIVIPAKVLLNEGGKPVTISEDDSVFVNIVAVKTVFKKIENKVYGFSYKSNNIKPVKIVSKLP